MTENTNHEASADGAQEAEKPQIETRNERLIRMGIDPAAMTAHQEKYTHLRNQAISTLTAMARLEQPGYGQVDFAGFMADALASVAANLGRADQLVAGRPGSWESDLVFQLVTGTCGWHSEFLLGYRTEPVKIYFSVYRLVSEPANGDWHDPFDAEFWAAGTRYESLPEGLPEHIYDEAAAADEADQEAIRTKWVTRYQDYARQFVTALQAAAASISELQVPVEITTSTDPFGEDDDSTPHPSEWAGEPGYDPIAYRIWSAALDAVPVPADWTAPAAGGEQA